MALELYHFDKSTCSQKVRICLAEKALDWVNRHVDLPGGEHVMPAYLAPQFEWRRADPRP